jgi:DNA-binding response OmpR family regulator
MSGRPRVLVVEDDADIAGVLRRSLDKEGYDVRVAGDGEAALEQSGVFEPDAVVLDLGLPKLDGMEVARRMRAEGDVPILMLTARDALDARVEGLDTGADDYLVKPFELGELAARARALLRRNGDGRAPLRVGSLELDPARHEASQHGRPLELTPKEFALLRYLMAHPGQPHSEFDLLTHVWDENANPLTRTVRVTVMTLRRKLSGRPIETVPGAGYRLREDT